ncbi:hypothetical protein GCM10011572_38110 [Pseudoduganella buxea]|nr:hypothetical protein GCM10011572_38110 [Pseudoduganella buxea]
MKSLQYSTEFTCHTTDIAMEYKAAASLCKIAVLVFGGQSWCLNGTAAETPYVYPFNTMTGTELVQKLTTEPVSDSDYRESDRAHYYLAGIKDGTQGIIWCFKRAMLPDELNYEIVHALKKRHRAAELSGNAAPLVLAELRRRYPCTGDPKDKQ